MAGEYSALAAGYDEAGLGDAAAMLRQRLFDKVQMEGWLGRRVLDLGCGTGSGACWFSGNGFRVTGIDRSAAMLAQARQRAEAEGAVVDWREADFTRTEVDDGYDLVLATGVFNELHSIRDLEAALRLANQALNMDKLLIFDLLTLRGVAERWQDGTTVLHDDPERLMILARSRYSYESSAAALHYTVYQRREEGWQRSDETHTLRAFPLQAVGTVLQRTGFKAQQVINGALEPFDPQADRTGQAIFIAAKNAAL
ncbi:MAG: class I SAM-dependent methyltransferase, partial [Anaerolineae bacterium]|nr:class I SAM-dependent methyltransferase [Anaerolineae bacterium]